MAINKNLPAGTIIFKYHEAKYSEHKHMNAQEKYEYTFKLLHIHNRRERAAGVILNDSFVPALTKLGIRVEHRSHQFVTAIGCRAFPYYTATGDTPYPSQKIMETASRRLDEQLQNEPITYQNVELIQGEFMETFIDKKLSNKDLLFLLQPTIGQYVANETYIE